MQACRVVAVLLGLIGFIMMLAAFDKDRFENERLLSLPDGILGVSRQMVMLLASVIYFLVGGGLLWVRDPIGKALLIFWLVLTCVTYWAGLAWLKPHGPCTLIVLVSQKVGLSPKTTGIVWGIFLMGSLAIGMAMMVMEWHRLKQMRMAMFMERYRQFRERGIPFNK